MKTTVRLTLHVPQSTIDRIIELAGSQRKKSEYVCKMIDSIYEEHKQHKSQTSETADDLNVIKNQLQAIYAQLGRHDSRIVSLEAQN